jgi:hypothetical protein
VKGRVDQGWGATGGIKTPLINQLKASKANALLVLGEAMARYMKLTWSQFMRRP